MPTAAGNHSGVARRPTPATAGVSPRRRADASDSASWSCSMRESDQHAAPRVDSSVVSNGPPRAVRRRSPLFCEHIFEHPVVEGEVGDRGLEPPVLIFELLEAARLVGIKAAVLGFP